LYDPDAMFAFDDNNNDDKAVVLMTVIEELDSFKKLNDKRGRSARLISRKLDSLRVNGRLSEGVKMMVLFKIEMNHHDVDLFLDFTTQKG
jgi:PhoH-like ATPase